MKKTICFEAVFVVMLLCAMTAIPEAGELRPFTLPESGPSPRQMEQRQRPYLQRHTTEKPTIYQKFEDDVRQMSDEKRKRYTQHYKNLRYQAYQDGDKVKIQYYNNLLNILEKYQ